MPPDPTRIGFVATRLARTDGVSLEAAKWRQVLEGHGHTCFCFAGESDWAPDVSYVVPEADFRHPAVVALNDGLFARTTRSSATSEAVQRQKEFLKGELRAFIKRFDIRLLVAENCLALPMHVPLALALTEVIAETGIAAIGHHHDFAWERTRYSINAANDYMRAAFPPSLPSLSHVVISSFAASQLALRTSMGAVLIPNVMDFDRPPPPPDAYAAGLREDLGLAVGERLLLQPTRIVPRKRIERAVELAQRLDVPCALVISHAAGDEGPSYEAYIRRYAAMLGVRLIFAAGRVNHERALTPAGQRIYSLADLYSQADLVTYLSSVEGFGNAFLEGVYHRRPMVVAGYDIFKVDIQPKGFRVVEVDEFVDESAVAQARAILDDPARGAEMAEHNFALGRQYYSFAQLDRKLADLTGHALSFS